MGPPSGNKRKRLELEKSSKVGDLKRLVQKILGENFLSLVTAEGHVLKDPGKSLEAAGVSDGDHLTAVVQQGKLAATATAFALWSDGGDKIVTRGHDKVSRNCSAIQDNLGSVQLVQGTRSAVYKTNEMRPGEYVLPDGAFAAILEDGSVVTWGSPGEGGDSSAVCGQLRNVQQVQGTSAFAAILADGSVVTWGHPFHGGDSSRVKDQLRNVKQIEATECAFAAILQDGSVVTWGDSDCGGDSSEVKDQLQNVQQIEGTEAAFAAVLSGGSLVAWGNPDLGGEFKIRSRVIDMDTALLRMCG